jgi:pimeloyl-ACP methyl ester carboxylesterase
MAEHCRAELARRGIEGPVCLLAMSLGAMVATDWAASHPQDVECCVLINTSMRPFSPFYRRLVPRHYPAILRLAVLGGTPRRWEETVLRLTARQPADPASTLHEWVRLREECPVSPRNALRQLVAAARYTAPGKAPVPPVFILSGAQDALVDSRCSQRLAAAWQASLAIHPTAGHDLPLDDAEWVATQVGQWRRKLHEGMSAGLSRAAQRNPPGT